MSGQLIAVDLLSQSSTQLFPLGAIHIAQDGGFYEYAKSEGGASAGHFCLIDQVNDATKLTTTNAASVGQKVGIACCDMTDEYYGWYFRGNGNFEAIIANGHTAAALLTTTATDGVAGASGVALDGARAIDEGVTATRVTVHCPTLLTVGIAAASD